MANIIDYINSNTSTFAEKPLNRVDGLIFSSLANDRIPEELPAACTEVGMMIGEFGSMSDLLGLTAPVYDPKGAEALLRACAASPRFKNVVARYAVSEWSHVSEKQFAAVTFILPTCAFIAFRGTDNTIVGWKENFNMSYSGAVPAQEEAREYVEKIAKELKIPIYLGGHSKGGNLAMYAAAACDDLTRLLIERCFAYDAPGLSEQTIEATNWKSAYPLIERVIPEESFVGLIWDNNDVESTVVECQGTGLEQHASQNWLIDGDDFKTVGALSYDAYRNAKRFGAWMKTLSAADRERFVELISKLVQATGEITVTGLMNSLATDSLEFVMKKFDRFSAEDQKFLREALGDLAATMLLGPAPKKAETPQEKMEAATDKIDDITAQFNSNASKLDKYMNL